MNFLRLTLLLNFALIVNGTLAQTYTPTEIGLLTNGAGGAYFYNITDVFVSGNTAFVTSQSGLQIVDISRPTNPRAVAIVRDGDGGAMLQNPSSVFVTNGFAFVASTGSNALEILDVSDPANPKHLSHLVDGVGEAALNSPSAVWVSGKYAYVGASNGISIVDISDPASPICQGVAQSNSVRTVVVVGTKLYTINNFANYFEVWDVSNPRLPVKLSRLTDGTGGASLNDPLDLAVNGNYAYVASFYGDALEVIDVSNPANPVHAAGLKNPGVIWGPFGLTMVGNSIFIANEVSNSIVVVDVSNPTSPQQIASLADGSGGTVLSYPGPLFVSGSHLCIGDMRSNSLEIVDVSVPASPKHQANLNTGSGGAHINLYADSYKDGNRLSVNGNLCFIGNESGLEVIDVSKPYAPRHLAFTDTLVNNVWNSQNVWVQNINSVFSTGSYVYLTTPQSNALIIIDVSKPSSPVYAGSIVDGQNGASITPTSVFVSGSIAYVTNSYTNSLELVDVSDPKAPTHRGIIHDGDGGAALNNPSAVYVAGSYAYVASTGSNALEIIDVSNPAAPVHVASLADGTEGATLNQPNDVTVTGTLALIISKGSNAIEIIDVSNPASPQHKSTVSVSNAVRVSVMGNFAFVVDNGYSLIGIDITSPTLPVVKSPFSSYNIQTPFGLAALNGNVFVVGSQTLDVMSIGPSVPKPPVALSATNIGQSYFTVNWNSVPNATGYLLDISTDNFATFVSGYNASPQTGLTLFVGDKIQSSTLYQYRVRAVNSGGVSDYSNVVPVGTSPDPPYLNPIDSITQTSFRVSWSLVPGARQYTVTVNNTINSGNYYFNGQSFPDPPTTSITIRGLQSGTSYTVSVKSSNSWANSGAQFLVVNTIPPNPVALPATGVAQFSFQANWNPARGATTYYVDVSADNFVTYQVKNLQVGNTTIVAINTGILAGTVYQYRVRAGNSGGVSGNSDPILLLTIPPTPVAQQADTTAHGTSFTAHWAQSQSATNYTLYVSSTSDFSRNSRLINTGTSLSYTTTNLKPDTTIYYKVSAGNATGYSPYSNPIKVSLSKIRITGVEPFGAGVLLFPNPAKTQLSFDATALSSGESAQIILFDVIGNHAMETKISGGEQRQLYVGDLSPGVYICLLKYSSGQVEKKKFVKL